MRFSIFIFHALIGIFVRENLISLFDMTLLNVKNIKIKKIFFQINKRRWN